MVNLICKNCGYRYESKYSEKKMCPYCGEMKMDVEPSAEKLLEEE